MKNKTIKLYLLVYFPFTRNLEKDDYFNSTPNCDLCLKKAEIEGFFSTRKKAEKRAIEISADCPAPPQSRVVIFKVDLGVK